MTRIIMNITKGMVMPNSIIGDLGIPPPRFNRLLFVLVRGASSEIVVIAASLSLLLLLAVVAKGSDVPNEDEPNKPSPCCRRCMCGEQNLGF